MEVMLNKEAVHPLNYVIQLNNKLINLSKWHIVKANIYTSQCTVKAFIYFVGRSLSWMFIKFLYNAQCLPTITTMELNVHENVLCRL